MIDILLEHGAILENSRAINAAMFRETNNADVIEMVKHLLKCGADINQLAFSMPGHHWGTRPLCIAAGLGNMELIHWLLDHGADPMARDRLGLPPLGWANDWGQDEAEKFFEDLYDKLRSEGKRKDGDL